MWMKTSTERLGNESRPFLKGYFYSQPSREMNDIFFLIKEPKFFWGGGEGGGDFVI